MEKHTITLVMGIHALDILQRNIEYINKNMADPGGPVTMTKEAIESPTPNTYFAEVTFYSSETAFHLGRLHSVDDLESYFSSSHPSESRYSEHLD